MMCHFWILDDHTAFLVDSCTESLGFRICKNYATKHGIIRTFKPLLEKSMLKDANVTILGVIVPRVGNAALRGQEETKSWICGYTACLTIGSGSKCICGLRPCHIFRKAEQEACSTIAGGGAGRGGQAI